MSAASEPFRSNLSFGLHAVAQPLAILRSWFDPLYNDGMSEAELRNLVSTSVEHVDRLCTLFGYLQQLVAAENLEPKPEEVEVLSFLADIADGVELWFQSSGMSLSLDVCSSCGSAWIDRSKMQQVLSNVLLISHSLARRGDQIELRADRSGDCVRISVRNENCSIDNFSSEASLGLASAATVTQKQHGNFSYHLHPFFISIEVPTQNKAN